jgi:hypothetical protein
MKKRIAMMAEKKKINKKEKKKKKRKKKKKKKQISPYLGRLRRLTTTKEIKKSGW